jgi:hypothetical protein
MKKIMWTSAIAGILITLGCVLLVLGTIPVKNTYNGKTLTVKYIIGKKVIDMTDAKFLPVPEEVHHNILRVGGTSIGRIRSGNFVNTRTKTRYKFYLTGKGKEVYFEIGDQKYLVDDIDVNQNH